MCRLTNRSSCGVSRTMRLMQPPSSHVPALRILEGNYSRGDDELLRFPIANGLRNRQGTRAAHGLRQGNRLAGQRRKFRGVEATAVRITVAAIRVRAAARHAPSRPAGSAAHLLGNAHVWVVARPDVVRRRLGQHNDWHAHLHRGRAAHGRCRGDLGGKYGCRGGGVESRRHDFQTASSPICVRSRTKSPPLSHPCHKARVCTAPSPSA